MSHTYASLPAFKDYIRDGGGAGTATTNDARLLTILEASSRTVDRYTDRSQFGSGFGPRTGTNRYDGRGQPLIALADDLLTVSTITLLDAPQSTSLGTAVADTDYYLRDRFGHYDTPPYREIVFHQYGSITWTGVGHRVTSVAGTYGYQAVTTSVGTIGTATASATAITLTGAAYAGQTILVDSEQMYVTASTGGTALTVQRGVNGTTAAAHATASAAVAYVYPSEVTDATLQIALRRWKARDAGADGSYGGGQVPTQVPAFAASELSILMRTVAHLKVLHVG